MRKSIVQQMKNKILIFDGAMGTRIQEKNLTPDDFGGEAFDGCNEILNLTQPDLIQSIHEEYLQAGADIIETNSFGANSVVLEEYGLETRTEEINKLAAQIARRAADKFSTVNNPRFVAGAMGPTTKTLSVTGGTTFDVLAEAYYVQAKALVDGGVDVLLLETAQDTLNVKAAGIGINRAFRELDETVPLMISGTIEPMGTTLAGQNIESFYISLEHLNPISVGLNCATGPEFMRDHIRTLSNLCKHAVSCYPNAGLPDENGHYHESPQGLAEKLADFATNGWLNIAGGCCGTTPDHIRFIAETLKNYRPRRWHNSSLHAVSGIEAVFLEEDIRPIIVGERTNVIGSRKFRNLIGEGKFEEASEIARKQIKNGAQIIDICLADPDRNEINDMENFLKYVVKKVKVPLMIDSTDAEVIELSLKSSQGKAIINSINLEDGLQRFEEIVPLIHKYGAAVIVGTIDEEGMAVTRERKLEVAKRSYDLLVNKYGVNPEDIIYDPLVFPVGTGEKSYEGSALETVEGIRLIKKELPQCKTILGVSNVSFGLPEAGREVLNAVFLYHCTKAGLDYAIVNTEKLERFGSIPEMEKKLAEELLFQTSHDKLTKFTEFYRKKKVVKKETTSNLSLEERLAQYIIEGSKDGLTNDLEEALRKYSPLNIINGPLMEGMAEVGRLFNNNELIVAEVLQSAEAMKAAVSYLEPYMEKVQSKTRGKILLATVKGDVHDIGKNLVDIILSNNGYDVVNLGIKVPPEQLIEASKKERPDLIGLSGLLVKSAQQMVVTAQDLKKANIETPLLVGGAALSRKFTETKIAPAYDSLVLYAKDAMNGLSLANQLMDVEERERLTKKLKESSSIEGKEEERKENGVKQNQGTKFSSIRRDVPIFQPPDFAPHIYHNFPISHLEPYINWRMLLGKHMGLKGNVNKLVKSGNTKALQLKDLMEELMEEGKRNGLIKAKGIYQFFPAQSEGNDIIIFDPNNQSRTLERFTFPRQQHPPYLCIADFLRPVQSGEMDVTGFFVVTAGEGIREIATKWKEEGHFLRSHGIQALALELAEAFAERIHHVIRDSWGFPDPTHLAMEERFSAKYQGIRVSFGYPACPELEDQRKLFKLLHPEKIGVTLTDGWMMDPEASVSAMVFAHPEARYFNVN